MSGDLPSQLALELSKTPTVSRMVGVFRDTDGNLAVVDVNGSRIKVPMVGAIPLPGLPVWVESQNGRFVCAGVSSQISPYGTVVKSTSTKVRVVPDDGVELEMPYLSGLTLTAGNRVSIDTASYVVTGKLSSNPVVPDDPGGGPVGGQHFSGLLVQATDSGSSNGGAYWQNSVNCDSAAGGAWFYGGGLQAALVGVTSFASIEVFLPLVYNRFSPPTLYLHTSANRPGSGLPTWGSSQVVQSPNGWVSLPTAWGPALRDGPVGFGFPPTVGVMASWRGTASDALSGAFRFSGRR